MNLRKNKSGTTLVELLVTFALLALLLTSAMVLVSSGSQMYYRVKYLAYSQSVGDMVMQRVTGEIASASGEVVVDSAGSAVSLVDGTASPLYITIGEDGGLLMHYREIKVVEGNVVQEAVLWPAVDWQYDEKAYHGFTIDTLSFEKVGGGNAVQIYMKLITPKTGYAYESTQTVECYNLAASDPVVVDTVYLEDDVYYQNKYS